MHNPEFALENETHKLLWDFEIQADHLISAIRPDLVINNSNNNNKKRTFRIVDFTVPVDRRVKSKQSDKYLNRIYF